MKKVFKFAALAVALVAGTIATAPKAEASLFPSNYTTSCNGGSATVFHYGWFGTYRSAETVDC
jgi:hypothetical protein